MAKDGKGHNKQIFYESPLNKVEVFSGLVVETNKNTLIV